MPRRGSSAGRNSAQSVTVSPRGGVTYEWRGQKAIEAISDVLVEGFNLLALNAERYWREEEWTKANHPQMTGTERDSGFFLVEPGPNGRVVLTFGASAPWTMYEEFGTIYRAGHYPIRHTMDRVAYRASDVIRRAAQNAGLV